MSRVSLSLSRKKKKREDIFLEKKKLLLRSRLFVVFLFIVSAFGAKNLCFACLKKLIIV